MAAKSIGLLLFLLLTGCKPRVWKEEPTSFLGIKLGQPLSASVPLCSKLKGAAADEVECAETYNSPAIINNAPMGLPFVTEADGVAVVVSQGCTQENAPGITADLKERYGEPTDADSYSYFWSGRKVRLRIDRSPEGNHCSFDATWISWVPKEYHHNPF